MKSINKQLKKGLLLIMKNIKAIIILFIVATVLISCSSSDQDHDATPDDKQTIYTSIYPVQYATERIGADSVSVKTIYPPGVDAHTYEPTSKEMTNIAKGDAFIYLGAGMEGFAETAADALKTQDVKLVELGKDEELFNTDNPHEHGHDGHDHGDYDPHIWIDPIRMIDMSEQIKNKLVELNPKNETIYNENFSQLKKDLFHLNEQYKSTLEPKHNKKILVSHAAFGYWEERYGVEQIAINGLSSGKEPSQKELTRIIDQAEKYQLDYIIFEQNSSNRVSEIIQDHLGVKSLTIHNLSVLTEEDINKEEDYLSLMKHNLDILDQATK